MSTTRVEAFLTEQQRITEVREALYERQKAVEPPPFHVREHKVAEVTEKGDLALNAYIRLHPEEVLLLIDYLGRWFVDQVETVEVAKEDGDGKGA